SARALRDARSPFIFQLPATSGRRVVIGVSPSKASKKEVASPTTLTQEHGRREHPDDTITAKS
ncbi:MAG: hypothetical protein FWD12_15280, partial [Alphaproteobacteria bacterium]|nr:hypothetical protein [Alphaproteobacteria bacterium]